MGRAYSCVKLTEQQVRKMFRLRREGLSMRQIGERLGIHRTHVGQILAGNAWARLGLHIDARTDNQVRRHLLQKKCSDDDVRKMFDLRSEGKTQSEIAECCEVTQGYVSRILRRRHHRDVKVPANYRPQKYIRSQGAH